VFRTTQVGGATIDVPVGWSQFDRSNTGSQQSLFDNDSQVVAAYIGPNLPGGVPQAVVLREAEGTTADFDADLRLLVAQETLTHRSYELVRKSEIQTSGAARSAMVLSEFRSHNSTLRKLSLVARTPTGMSIHLVEQADSGSMSDSAVDGIVHNFAVSSSPSPTPTEAVVRATPVSSDPASLDRRFAAPSNGCVATACDGFDLARLSVATASHTAPSGVDASGHRVDYAARNLIDGNVTTAWRTPGDGQGESLTLTWDRELSLRRVCVVVGYAKIDPTDGTDRFLEDRRLTMAQLATGDREVAVAYDPRSRAPQCVDLTGTTRRVTLRIAKTQSGRRDFTAISEVSVEGQFA
jgi:hypothetical protein